MTKLKNILNRFAGLNHLLILNVARFIVVWWWKNTPEDHSEQLLHEPKQKWPQMCEPSPFFSLSCRRGQNKNCDGSYLIYAYQADIICFLTQFLVYFFGEFQLQSNFWTHATWILTGNLGILQKSTLKVISKVKEGNENNELKKAFQLLMISSKSKYQQIPPEGDTVYNFTNLTQFLCNFE